MCCVIVLNKKPQKNAYEKRKNEKSLSAAGLLHLGLKLWFDTILCFYCFTCYHYSQNVCYEKDMIKSTRITAYTCTYITTNYTSQIQCAGLNFFKKWPYKTFQSRCSHDLTLISCLKDMFVLKVTGVQWKKVCKALMSMSICITHVVETFIF